MGVLFDFYGDVLAGNSLNWCVGTLPPLGWVGLSVGVGIEAVEAEAIRDIGEIVAEAVGAGSSRGTSGVLKVDY